DAKKDDRIYLDGDVVLSNHILRRNLDRVDAQGHADDAVDGGEHQDHARSFGLREEPAQTQDHAAFIFSQDYDGIERVPGDDEDDDRWQFEHFILLTDLA